MQGLCRVYDAFGTLREWLMAAACAAGEVCNMDKRYRAVYRNDPEFEKELLESFISKQRTAPARPAASRTSTVIVRKEIIPFYYAIYDHELKRYTRLMYRNANPRDTSLQTVPVPEEKQPINPDAG